MNNKEKLNSFLYPNEKLNVEILKLIGDVLFNNQTNQEEMIRYDGFPIVEYLLFQQQQFLNKKIVENNNKYSFMNVDTLEAIKYLLSKINNPSIIFFFIKKFNTLSI